MSNILASVFVAPKPVIATIHLHPLPGSPLYDKAACDFGQAVKIALEEAKILESEGVDGLLIENTRDYPYRHGEEIGGETAAALAVAAAKVKDAVAIPVGIHCRRNGADAALAAASASGARWIRVSDWSAAGTLARYRKAIDAADVLFACDIDVRQCRGGCAADGPAHDYAGAGGLIVTGCAPDAPLVPESVKKCGERVSVPVYLGDGVTADNAAELMALADGAIVGGWFKKDGDWKNPVDPARVGALMRAMEKIRTSWDFRF